MGRSHVSRSPGRAAGVAENDFAGGAEQKESAGVGIVVTPRCREDRGEIARAEIGHRAGAAAGRGADDVAVAIDARQRHCRWRTVGWNDQAPSLASDVDRSRREGRDVHEAEFGLRCVGRLIRK